MGPLLSSSGPKFLQFGTYNRRSFKIAHRQVFQSSRIAKGRRTPGMPTCAAGLGAGAGAGGSTFFGPGLLLMRPRAVDMRLRPPKVSIPLERG